ncbi:type 1 glutamine amidotransferase-like domain-containing protein [Candidatus Falkowbacteria bacterium]|nr:type 1 glutamine amidotransferase-like domain-containing protein [Candidatus Falkowbacteria bacterium]
MKLLLTSAGLSNKSIAEALVDLAGRPFAELNLAFVPTAANVEAGDKWWLINDLVNCKNLGFKSIDIVDISALPKDIWQPRLEAADVFLFGGGNTFHLMYWLQKSGLSALLPELLETRVYVGISAGSMVACKSLDLSMSEKLYDDVPGEYDKDEGLDYVDLLVRPHLNSPYFPNLNMENLEKLAVDFPETFYALDDQSAIKVDGGRTVVVSEGVWKKFN